MQLKDKIIMRFIAAICFIIALALAHNVAFGQENLFPYLLGPDKPSPWKTTPGGILYQSNGFDTGEGLKPNGKPHLREKYVTVKTPNFFHKHDVDHLIEPFQNFARQMIHESADGSAGFIATEIDRQKNRILQMWKDCGDGQVAGSSKRITYRQVAQTFDPRILTIEIMGRQWWSDFWKLWIAGEVEDGRKIKVVGIGEHSILTDRKSAGLVNFSDLVGWEIGNAVGIFAGLFGTTINNINQEIGDQSPCRKH